MNYPRSNAFDLDFVRANMMGPNALKLLEELSGALKFQPGMRVLDLGCGRGLTSIFLAKEFGVTVFAVDLWINATENYQRFREFGLEDRIIPIHSEAHDLPFAEAYFDAAISVDSYHYFGHEETYLDTHLAPLVKPGGQIGIAVPGFLREYGGNIPHEISPFVKPEYNFHSHEWWKALWSGSDLVRVQTSNNLSCCAESWEDWLACDNEHAISDREMMKAEGGNHFSIVGLTAIRI